MARTPGITLREMRANLACNGPELYIGTDGRRLIWAGPQQALLVLGPPRSGKTSSLVIPNVLAAPGPVVVTSTKPDILEATLASRLEMGRCWVLDPTGTVEAPPGAHMLRWSPIEASLSWEEALVSARVMTSAARPHGKYGDSAHWTERAEALLAPLFHAAALCGGAMRQAVTWALRHDLAEPMAILANQGGDADVALEVLNGIAATEERERSGIFSTAASTLAAYRSSRALDLAETPNFRPAQFPAGADTIYVCAPSRSQAIVAPVVVAFLEQVRAATYRSFAGATLRLPVTLVLDEVANVAPLPDLPAMVSEGGGQGLLTMACLQDLSQARVRWGVAAEGFFSLFGAKAVLPGVGDLRTLEVVSRLAGQMDVPVKSHNRSAWWATRPTASTTTSWRRQERLPVDKAHSLPLGTALVVTAARRPALAALTPWWGYSPFSDARSARLPANYELPAAPPVDRPAHKPVGIHSSAAPQSSVTVNGPPPAGPIKPSWHRVPGQRRLHPPPPSA